MNLAGARTRNRPDIARPAPAGLQDNPSGRRFVVGDRLDLAVRKTANFVRIAEILR
jgi:hypothetical protein